MLIRKAKKTDINNIQILMNNLNDYRKLTFNDGNKEFHERVNPYADITKEDIKKDIIFIAVDEFNEWVWFIRWSIHKRKNHKLSNLAYIDEIYVWEEQRGQWIAKSLLWAFEDECRAQWCDHITTHTDTENKGAQSFYQKNWMSSATIEFWKKL